MIIEGKNAVLESLKSKTAINRVYLLKNTNDKELNEISYLAKKRNIKVEIISRQELNNLSKTKNNQGVLANINNFKYSEVEDIIETADKNKEDLFLLILDKIEDPHNLGSIIRSAECAGVNGIILPKNRACPVNETVVRISSGAINHMKIASVGNLNNTIKMLKKLGVFVFALEANGQDIYKTDLTGKIALVVGSEGFGVSKLTASLCDGIVSFPMYGKVNSLNASVASGLAVYEAVRQRKK